MSIANLEEAQKALNEFRARFKDLADAASDWLWEMDGELRFTYVTDGVSRFNGGIDPSIYYGKTREEIGIRDHVDPDKWKRHLADLEARRPFRNFRYSNVDPAGDIHYWSISGRPVFDAAGAFLGYRGLGRDVTARVHTEERLREVNAELQSEIAERRQAEEALKQARNELERRVEERTRDLHASERRFRDFAEASADWFWEMDADLRFTYMSENVERLAGVSPEWHYGKTRTEILGDDYDRDSWADHLQTLQERRPFRNFEYFRDGQGAEPKWLRTSGLPVFDGDGAFVGYRGTGSDITEQKLAEERLRTSEEKLVRAQKMEAVGQLTGGVAHDFNNLLAVISGTVEFLHDEIGDNPLLDTIDHATRRGAELTQRLLAFSRQQALQPQSIDLAELIPVFHDLLDRTLGEPVEILTDIEEGLWPVTADPGQLENALLNLSINARDAMPDGGVLEIGCSNIVLQEDDHRISDEVAAGDYVQIAVRDTGTGMPEEVLEHAFEPFYTTKDVGEGSGLGLSMVYGFARQSGGDAIIESEPGRGTVIRLFLPRSDKNLASDERKQNIGLKRGRGEVILVLEDDPDVRSLVVAALEGLGYRVLEAGDASTAMQVLEDEADSIDLLLSDVVLPGGTSGPELAAKAKELYPRIKIVLMTGYASDLYATDKAPDIGQALLTKPFRRADLATVIYDTLAT